MRLEEQELKELVSRIKMGDRSAFTKLFTTFETQIYNFLVYKIGDSTVAEDILQETFLKIWRKKDTLDESLSIKSLLFTMANNAAMNHFRHKKVVYAHQANYRSDKVSRSPEEELNSHEFQVHLLKTIEGLPEKTRVTFMMSRFEDLSYKEIAERTDVSIKTVESHIGKALRIIREELEKMKE